MAARTAPGPSRRDGPRIPPLSSAAEITVIRLLLEPWRWLTAPTYYGLDRIPGHRPFLLVGNHTLMGVLDVPYLLPRLLAQVGDILGPSDRRPARRR